VSHICKQDTTGHSKIQWRTDIRDRHPERQVDEKFSEDKSVLADLGKWRVQIWWDFDDLFQPLSGVPPPEDHDFSIHTDRTAKIPH